MWLCRDCNENDVLGKEMWVGRGRMCSRQHRSKRLCWSCAVVVRTLRICYFEHAASLSFDALDLCRLRSSRLSDIRSRCARHRRCLARMLSVRPIAAFLVVPNVAFRRYNHTSSHTKKPRPVCWCEEISIRDNVPSDFLSKARGPSMLPSGIRFPSSTP